MNDMRFPILMVNSNRGRVTYSLRDCLQVENHHSRLLCSDCRPYRRNHQQCQCNLYIAEKYI